MRGGVWIVAVHRALTAIFIDGEGHSRVHRDASDRATPTPSTTPLPLINASTVLYTMQVDCGPGVPSTYITCGYGAYNTSVNTTCAPPSTAPVCGYWNTLTDAWDTEGCVSQGFSFDNKSILCKCSHLTDFSGRFASLGTAQAGIFAQVYTLGDTSIFQSKPYVLYLMGGIIFIIIASLSCAVVADSRSSVRFWESLRADTELGIMERISRLQGKPFILDRVLNTKSDGKWLTDTARTPTSSTNSAQPAGGDSQKSNPLLAARPASASPLAGQVGDDDIDADAVLEAEMTLAGFTPAMLDESAAANTATAGGLSVDPYAAALYLRIISLFDKYRITPKMVRAVSSELPQSHAAEIATVLQDTAESAPVSSKADLSWRLRQGGDGTPETRELAVKSALARARFVGSIRSMISSTDNPIANASLKKSIAPSAHSLLRDGSVQTLTTMEQELAANKSVEAKVDPRAVVLQGMKSIRFAAERLDDSSTSLCVRLWRLKGFLLHVWGLQLWFQHTVLSAWTRFDPRQSRFLRVTLVMVVALGNIFVAAFWYNWRMGGDPTQLLELDLAALIVLSLFSALMQLPITVIAAAGLAWAGASQFMWRFPSLAQELERRRRLERRMAKLSYSLLRRELEADGKAHLLAGSTAPATNDSGSKLELPTGPLEELTLEERLQQHGWIDPPPCCQLCCCGLLRCCGRHASQREAWLKEKEAAAAQRRAIARRARLLRKASSNLGSSSELGQSDSEDDDVTAVDVDAVVGVNANIIIRGGVWIGIRIFACCRRVAVDASERIRASSKRLSAAPPAAVSKSRSLRGLEGVYAASAAEAEDATTAPAALVCCSNAWTLRTLAVLSVIAAYLAFVIFYMIIWSLYQTQDVVIAFMKMWAISVAIAFLVLEPLLILGMLLAVVVVWPTVVPLIIWIPVIGPRLAGELASPASASGQALSGRMENLTLIRAAGYASALSPDAAVIAFAANAVFASVISGVAEMLGRRRLSKAQRGSKKKLTSGMDLLSTEARYELVVKRYLRFSLKAAVDAKKAKEGDGLGAGVVVEDAWVRASPAVPPPSTGGGGGGLKRTLSKQLSRFTLLFTGPSPANGGTPSDGEPPSAAAPPPPSGGTGMSKQLSKQLSKMTLLFGGGPSEAPSPARRPPPPRKSAQPTTV